MTDKNHFRICIAGADGRMGSAVIREGERLGFAITGAIAEKSSPYIGNTIKDAGLGTSTTVIHSPSDLSAALREADVLISFTTPDADCQNLPIAAKMGIPIVCGTTGFDEGQMSQLQSSLRGTGVVFAPNFSIGIALLKRMLDTVSLFPDGYDISILEAHHTGKKDSPSGTAKLLADAVAGARGYERTVTFRNGQRAKGELEVMSIRAGGIPGIHDIIIAGEHEMIRVEHTAFSRSVFASGSLLAAKWIYTAMKEGKKGIFSMDDVIDGMAVGKFKGELQ